MGLLLMLVGTGIVLIRVKHSRVMKSIEAQIEMEEQIKEEQREIELDDAAHQRYADGRNYLKTGNYKDAELAFKEFITRKPHFAEGHYYLGVTYAKLGRYEEAVLSFKEAISRNPGWVTVYYDLGVVYTMLGRYEEAMQQYETLNKMNSPSKAKGLLDLINESKSK